jgi:hypothetical protein
MGLNAQDVAARTMKFRNGSMQMSLEEKKYLTNVSKD